MDRINNPLWRRRLSALSKQLRRKRGKHVLTLISQCHARHGQVRILDLGGTAAYWSLFDRPILEAQRVHITLINRKDEADHERPPPADDPLFTHEFGDACHLPQFDDNAFDLVHSNSVIEHVGLWPKMEAFAQEVRRLAPAYFVQTPYQWFPIEPHLEAAFIHWWSDRAQARWIMRNRPNARGDYGWAMRAIHSAYLLDKQQMQYLFADATHVDEKVFGLTKSLMAIRSPE